MTERDDSLHQPPALIDRSVKALIRAVPEALFRLAGVEVDRGAVHFEDIALNLPELRADHVLLHGAENDPARWALHVEYQLQPDPSVMPGWLVKAGALARQLGISVILLVVYLERGSYATFPSAFAVEAGGLKNEFSFPIVRLWEHADQIRGDAVPELAPLLALCEDNPTEQTMREEREIILRLDTTPAVRAELLAVALTVGLRYFARDLLERIFREELEMLKEASIIQEWIEQAAEEAEARGEARRARAMLRRVLSQRFGELPEAMVRQIEQQDPDWCESMAVRAITAPSLESLGLASSAPENGALRPGDHPPASD
jgi:hypothetical protein